MRHHHGSKAPGTKNRATAHPAWLLRDLANAPILRRRTESRFRDTLGAPLPSRVVVARMNTMDRCQRSAANAARTSPGPVGTKKSTRDLPATCCLNGTKDGRARADP